MSKQINRDTVSVGDVFKGRHKDNCHRTVKVIGKTDAQVRLLHIKDGVATRSDWGEWSNLFERYDFVPPELCSADVLEAQPKSNLPPRRFTSDASLLTKEPRIDLDASTIQAETIEALYGSLRKHQLDGVKLIRQFFAGLYTDRKAFGFITPGGGKSGMIKCIIHEGIRRGVRRFLVVVPRKSLRRQMIDDLRSDSFGGRLDAGQETHERALFGNYQITVITYHRLVSETAKFLRFASVERSFLFLDEVHHLAGREEDDGKEDIDEADVDAAVSWEDAVLPVSRAAEFTLAVSGTPYRGDGRPIPFLSYDADGAPLFDIVYTRASAIADGSCRPINFRMVDGVVEFERFRKEWEVTLSDTPRVLERNALHTVLGDPAYRNWVLDTALKDWFAYRLRTGHESKAIILAPSQKVAIEIQLLIERKFGLKVALAISEKKNAHEHLTAFRNPNARVFDVLVTVQMAYEGLDVPAVTHIVCLSRFRKRGWLEQAFARATRIDRKCNIPAADQTAFIYVPNDPQIQRIIDGLMEEESCALKAKSADRDKADGAGGSDVRRSSFRPIGAEPGKVTDAHNDTIFGETEQQWIDRARSFLGDDAAGMAVYRLMSIGRKLDEMQRAS